MSNIIDIDGVKVHKDVLTTKFACDYDICKGECCYVSISDESFEGPSISIEEREEIGKHSTHRKFGEIFINCVDGRCVFNDGGCKLSEVPIDCRLYPLVVTFEKKHKHLRVGHYYDRLCNCGYEKGKKNNILLIDFCKEGLLRRFGEFFYKRLKRYALKYNSTEP